MVDSIVLNLLHLTKIRFTTLRSNISLYTLRDLVNAISINITIDSIYTCNYLFSTQTTGNFVYLSY